MAHHLSSFSSDMANARHATIRRLALAGIIAPLWFALTTALLDVLHYQWLISLGLSPFTRSPSSVHTQGTYDWLMIVNFVVFGLLVIAFGLDRGVKAGRWSKIGIGFLIVFGTAFVLSGFPCDCLQGNPVTFHGQIHNLAFYLLLFSQIPAYVFLWHRFRKDPHWWGYDWYSLAIGVLVFPLFVIFGVLLQNFDGFYLWLLVIPLAWLEVMALHLWAVSPSSPVSTDVAAPVSHLR